LVLPQLLTETLWELQESPSLSLPSVCASFFELKYDLIVGYDNPLYVLYDLALVAIAEKGFCRFL